MALPAYPRAFSRFSTALTLACCVAAAAEAQRATSSPARVASFFATVTDAQGRLVPNLIKEDFELLDDGKPQPLVLFNSTVQPINLIVMLDTRASMAQSSATPSLDHKVHKLTLKEKPAGGRG